MLLKNILPAIIWSLIILGLTLSPGSSIPNVQIIGIDKAVHVILFGTLMFLLLRGLLKQKQTSSFPDNPLLISFIFCLSYGILIECIQFFVPGRSFSVYDMIANTSGILAAYLIFKFLSVKKAL